LRTSLLKARARVSVLLVFLIPWAFLSSGCSFLPSRQTVKEKVGELRDVTEERLREKWESSWKPALREEAKSVALDLAASTRDMLKAQAATYTADLEAKIADGRASTTERWIYWLLCTLGLAGTGKGVQQGGKLKSILTAVVTAIEIASKSGAPLTAAGIKELVKSEATKLGVDSILYPLVQAVAAKVK